mmetsp:Transcript_29297/g.64676  ORF Transcript_29297/g.64676 Transcript_29297/m.64676 type:complete len:155 (+) Transcript_29297:285-749(+)
MASLAMRTLRSQEFCLRLIDGRQASRTWRTWSTRRSPRVCIGATASHDHWANISKQDVLSNATNNGEVGAAPQVETNMHEKYAVPSSNHCANFSLQDVLEGEEIDTAEDEADGRHANTNCEGEVGTAYQRRVRKLTRHKASRRGKIRCQGRERH